MSFWSLVLLWLASVAAVWRVARSGKRRLESRITVGRALVSSALTGVYVTYTFAPSGISAGFVAVPVPATLGLVTDLLSRHARWSDIRLHVLSLAVCFVLVTVVHYPFACASRRAKERDTRFDAAQRLKA
jgi:uncharacterized protein YijF (DUF1287 family)